MVIRGRPRDPERRRRRLEEAEHAAVALFLSAGLESVTIDQIVERAGWSKGNFYRYFQNKEGLLETLYAPFEKQLREAFARLRRAAEKDDLDKVRSAHELFAAQLSLILLQDRDAARLYLQERRGPDVGARRPIARIAQRIETEAVAVATAAHRRGLLGAGDPRIVALAVVGAVEHVLHAYLEKRLEGDALAVTSELTKVVLGGILRSGS